MNGVSTRIIEELMTRTWGAKDTPRPKKTKSGDSIDSEFKTGSIQAKSVQTSGPKDEEFLFLQGMGGDMKFPYSLGNYSEIEMDAVEPLLFSGKPNGDGPSSASYVEDKPRMDSNKMTKGFKK